MRGSTGTSNFTRRVVEDLLLILRRRGMTLLVYRWVDSLWVPRKRDLARLATDCPLKHSGWMVRPPTMLNACCKSREEPGHT